MTMLSKLNRILLGAAVAVGSAIALPGVARAEADLALTLTSPKKLTVHYGDTLTFKATVTNTSAANATGTKISEVTVPVGWTLVEVSNCKKVDSAQTSPVPCFLTSAGSQTTGEIFGELDPAAPKYAVVSNITLAAPDKIPTPEVCPDPAALETTRVTITSDDDPNAANDAVTSKQFVIGPYQDLAITLAAPASAGYGDEFDVAVQVTNLGPCAAHNVLADDEAGTTALNLEFLGSTAPCENKNPLADTCELGDLNKGDTRTWTLHYRIGGYPSSLTSSKNPVGLTVFADSADYFDPKPENDSSQTVTVATRSQGGCSTGELGGALSLLALGVPFLRRRRKS